MNAESNIRVFFTGLVALFPLLFIYTLGGSSFTLADFLLVAFIPVLICYKTIKCDELHFKSPFLPFLLYVVFHFLLFVILSDEEKFIGSTLRYVLYLCVVVFGKEFFDFDVCKKIYKWVCIVSTAYLFVQSFLFHFLNYYLPGYIQNSLFPVVANQIALLEDNLLQTWFSVLRPSSFFAEPAHYSEYVVNYLALSLFCLDKKRNLYIAIFLTVGLLVSMSSTGILTAFFVWLFFLLSRLNQIRLPILIGFSMLPIVFFILVNTSFFSFFLERMEMGQSASGRFQGYEDLSSSFSSLFDVLFGFGMDTSVVGTYLAGFARLYVFFGFLGCVCFLCCMGMLFFNKNVDYLRKMLILVFLFLNVGTELLFQPMVCLFLLLICSESKEKVFVEEVK